MIKFSRSDRVKRNKARKRISKLIYLETFIFMVIIFHFSFTPASCYLGTLTSQELLVGINQRAWDFGRVNLVSVRVVAFKTEFRVIRGQLPRCWNVLTVRAGNVKHYGKKVKPCPVES